MEATKIENQYFYPRSPCGERHGRINDISRLMKISIHALLAESDACWYIKEMIANISIHALLAESDLGYYSDWANDAHFYPRSPCGERRISPQF